MALSRTDFGPYGATPPQGTGAFVTGSFTPPSNSLLVVISLFSNESSANGDSGYVLTGGGWTYTKRDSMNHSFAADNAYNVQLWTAPVGTGASMQLTLTHTGIGSYSGYIFPYAYEGYNTSSPVGGTDVNANAGTSHTLTLSSAPATDSEVIGGIAVITANADGSDASITAGSGFTLIGSAQYVTDSFAKAQTEFRTGSASDSVTFTTATSASSPFDTRVYGALEIKAAAAGGGAAARVVGTGLTESRFVRKTRLAKVNNSMVGWRAQRGLLVPDRKLAA
jgi:hypothetical protein